MNTINKKTDRIMVDLETLGKRAGCAILSIGAVAFCPESNTTGKTFYQVIFTGSCVLHGLHRDPETLAWWNEQSFESRQVLRHAQDFENSHQLEYVLQAFNEYVSQYDNPEIWGNGADFDNAILIAAMAACGIEPAWKFWNNRCFRTLRSMYPDLKMDRHGVHHNALDDAITQARHLLSILKRQGTEEGFKEAISTWKDATPDAGESNIEAMIQRINWLENKNNEMREVLELAKNGLHWYQDSNPESVSETDYETMERIDTVLKGGAA